jgi:hypothetical protein
MAQKETTITKLHICVDCMCFYLYVYSNLNKTSHTMHEIICLKAIITKDGMFLQYELTEGNVPIISRYLKFKLQYVLRLRITGYT